MCRTKSVSTVALIAVLIVELCIVNATSAAPTGPFDLALIRVSYTDLSSTAYTSAEIEQAAGELEDFFGELSYGQLDLNVSVTEVTLADTAANYWDDESELKLRVDASTLAADGGFDFTGIDSVLFLHPVGSGDGVGRTFRPGDLPDEVTYNLAANIWEHTVASPNPPGPSGVWWGAWAHEIGHILILSEVSNWGHPSGYASGYDLMDSAYPAHVSAYTLLGPPTIAAPEDKRFFAGWLASSQVVTVEAPTAGTVGETIVLAALSQHPDVSPSPQVIKIPLGAERYYFVEARRRIAADARHSSPGIWDEGVHITEVIESRDIPVRLIHPCHQDGDCLGDCYDRTAPQWVECKCDDPQDDRGVDDIPGNCWRYALWHVGDVFKGEENDIEVRVDAEAGNGFAVTVTRGVVPGTPDVFLIPWLTPPMNTWETIDIWVDSSCNGYEDEGGELRYGRRDDGTVVFNGDAPCANHDNRIYCTIRNGGEAAAENVVVTFRVTDPLGVGIRDSEGWMEVGTATGADFPDLGVLPSGGRTDVYVTWVPDVELAEADFEEGLFNFHSCVQVIVDTVAGEVVTSNQDGDGEQENLTAFEASFDALAGLFRVPETEFYIRNLDGPNDPVPPRSFFLHVHSELPEGWTYSVGDGELEQILAPGEIRSIPVRINVPPTAPIGKSYLLKVEATTPKRYVRSELEGYPEPSVEIELEKVAGVVIAAQTVLETEVSLSAQLSDTRPPEIVAHGQLSPPVAETILTVDFIDPLGSTTACPATTTPNGSFECLVEPDRSGEWVIRALWQGSLEHGSAASKPVVVDVPESAVRDSDQDGVPDSRDKCPNTVEGTPVDDDGCPDNCGPCVLVPVLVTVGLLTIAKAGPTVRFRRRRAQKR